MSLDAEILHLRAEITQKTPHKMVFAGLIFYFARVLKTVYAVYVDRVFLLAGKAVLGG